GGSRVKLRTISACCPDNALRPTATTCQGISQQDRWSLKSQDHHSRAHLHPAVEIDHVLIGHPDATRGNRMSDVFGLVGAVNAIELSLPASVEVWAARAHWMRRAARDVARKRT